MFSAIKSYSNIQFNNNNNRHERKGAQSNAKKSAASSYYCCGKPYPFVINPFDLAMVSADSGNKYLGGMPPET